MRELAALVRRNGRASGRRESKHHHHEATWRGIMAFLARCAGSTHVLLPFILPRLAACCLAR